MHSASLKTQVLRPWACCIMRHQENIRNKTDAKFFRDSFLRESTHTQITVLLTHTLTVAVGWSSDFSFPSLQFELTLIWPWCFIPPDSQRQCWEKKMSSGVLKKTAWRSWVWIWIPVKCRFVIRLCHCQTGDVFWNCTAPHATSVHVCVYCICGRVSMHKVLQVFCTCGISTHSLGLQDQWLHHRSISLDDSSSLTLSGIKAIPVDGEKRERTRDSGKHHAARHLMCWFISNAKRSQNVAWRHMAVHWH